MDIEFLLLLVLIVGAIWLVRRLFPAQHAPRLTGPHARRMTDTGLKYQGQAIHHYKAVSVRPEAACCAAAESIQGQRFLVQDAPMIPLPGCSRSKCHCVYAHHTDRRGGTRDRRNLPNVRVDGGSERRLTEGRRATDLLPAV